MYSNGYNVLIDKESVILHALHPIAASDQLRHYETCISVRDCICKHSKELKYLQVSLTFALSESTFNYDRNVDLTQFVPTSPQARISHHLHYPWLSEHTDGIHMCDFTRKENYW